MQIIIVNAMHLPYTSVICATIAESAKVLGMATRTLEHIQEKIKQGNAVNALDSNQSAVDQQAGYRTHIAQCVLYQLLENINTELIESF